jgi:hypothetical protein
MARQDAIKESKAHKATKTGDAAKTSQVAKGMALPVENPPAPAGVDIAALVKIWVEEEGPWWLCSFVFHMVLVCSLALFGSSAVVAVVSDAPSFDEAKVDNVTEAPKVEHFELGETPEEPTELNTETLTMEPPGSIAQEEKKYDDNPVFMEGGGMSRGLVTNQPNLGGIGGFEIRGIGPGPAIRGKGGVGESLGDGRPGFGGRSQGSRKKMLGGGGGTRQSERAVAGALNWLARHQSPDGSWSLSGFTARCKDKTCTSPGTGGSLEIAGTAFGLLPFLGAGQTHESSGGPYKKAILAGIHYLIGHQKPDGSFAGSTTMYDHGLASIALCECFGMTGDEKIKKTAQAALDYIALAQDPNGGGWRYIPQQPGDTSVTGWQVMALKSGQMAYLNVNPLILEKAKQFLDSVSSGGLGSTAGVGHFGYTSKDRQTSATNAVGLLCCQYLGVPRTDPAIIEGTAYLMQNQPATGAAPDIYYWYYGTQVMHNQPGPDWDAWNRKMRRRLIDTQSREGCATGSWDPKEDQWGVRGGRVMETSLSALTLEVYYRYLPLYKLDREGGGFAPAPAEKPAADKLEKDDKPAKEQ